jgi:hypothetical protein
MSIHTNGDPKIHTLATELVMWLLNYTLQVRRFGGSQALKHHHLYLPVNEFGVQQIYVHVTEAPDVLVLWSWWEFWWVPICYRQWSYIRYLQFNSVKLCEILEMWSWWHECVSSFPDQIYKLSSFAHLILSHIHGPWWFVRHMLRRFKKYKYVRDAFCQCRVHRLG